MTDGPPSSGPQFGVTSGEKEEARIDEELRRAYRDSADEALAEIEPLIGSQAWPDE